MNSISLQGGACPWIHSSLLISSKSINCNPQVLFRWISKAIGKTEKDNDFLMFHFQCIFNEHSGAANPSCRRDWRPRHQLPHDSGAQPSACGRGEDGHHHHPHHPHCHHHDHPHDPQGNNLADQLNAHFLTSETNQKKNNFYNNFFREVWNDDKWWENWQSDKENSTTTGIFHM